MGTVDEIVTNDIPQYFFHFVVLLNGRSIDVSRVWLLPETVIMLVEYFLFPT